MRLGSSRYDGELQMFTDEAREPNPARLRFLRWLVEDGQLEHEVASPPVGAYAIEALGAEVADLD